MSATAADVYATWPTRYPQRRAVGYMCTYVPEEILHAAGLSPIRILPTPSPAPRAEAHLQSYTCSLARSCLDQALAGKLNFLHGVVFAHTCDTMQGLADIWRTAFPNQFVETVVLPVALNSPHAKRYLVAELHRFAQAVEHHFGVTITADRLLESIRLFNGRRRALADLDHRRTTMTAVAWLNTMNAALVTPPEEFVLPDSVANTSASGPRVMVVGSTMDEPTLAQVLDEVNVQWVADDLCTGTRYWDTNAAESGDPFESLAERQLTRLACPCKHRSLDHRANHLLTQVREREVKGVIFYLKKYCDPHAWDYVPLAEALSQKKIPHLLLETDQATAAGPLRVRVEAFLEMLAED